MMSNLTHEPVDGVRVLVVDDETAIRRLLRVYLTAHGHKVFEATSGQEALETLAHIVGRIESIWKPVTATESFEIVRRRLFAGQVDYPARDAVIDAFGDMYRNAAGEFPSGVAERDYYDRMVSAYPIHPDLFDRLYMEWSTLDRFQRTRGVLRLMASGKSN